MPHDRPNILFIMADQLTPFMLGAYGNRSVVSDAIDELAAEGVVFDNCYTNSPLCVPGRASLVSGRFCSRIASFDNASELPASIPTFMHVLRSTGYDVAAAGKMHFIGPDQLHGFEERLTTDIYPAGILWIPDWNRGAYPNPGSSALFRMAKAGVSNANPQLAYDEEVQFRSLEKIRNLGQRQDDRPFFFWVSYTHPHDPFCNRRELWDLYEGRDIPMPAVPEAIPEQWPESYRALHIHHGGAHRTATEEEIMRTRRGYMASVTYVDRKVQELLACLEESGLAENTIVVFTSDHGEMLGEHGIWAKRLFYEWSARVPLIVRWPGRFQTSRVAGVTSLVDLFPTLTQFAGVAPVPGLDGRSLVPLLKGDAADWHGTAISEYMGEGVLHPMRMVRRGRYKYVHVHDETPMLFDLETDPNEVNNIAGDEQYRDVEAELARICHHDWDGAALDAEVRRSQQERFLIRDALIKGKQMPWDWQPRFNAAEQYARGFEDQRDATER
ncbi:MAG: choline-sulfatase [Nitrospiraceae bacterium]|nr:choline-sulfatase [Nitrospiraceae bacterium]